MTAGRRTRLRADERRAQLVSLGVEMLATRTLDELSVEDLAEQAGISRGLLFHYFRNKAEFHLEVVRAAATDLLERTRPDAEWPVEQALARSLAAYVDYVTANRLGYLALVRGAVSGDQDVRAVFDATRTTLTDRVLASLSELDVPVEPITRLAVRGWVAFTEEVTVSWLGAPESAVDREGLLALLVRGLPVLVFGAAVWTPQ